MLRALAKLLAILNSETEPGQISLAFCLAMVAGLTPLLSLHNLAVILLLLALRANVSAFLLGWVFFSGLAFALDPLFHHIGLAVLTTSALEGLFGALYNSTMWRVEHFNNSIVMGSAIVSGIAFLPLFMASNVAIRRYREQVLARIRDTKLFTLLKASRFFGLYQRISGAGNAP